MDIFYWQVLASFVAGGLIIATLTVFAERAPRSVSGIIAALPSTVVVGLISLVLIYDVDFVLRNRFTIPISLLGAVVFCLGYVLIARLVCHLIKSIWFKVILSFFAGFLGWILFPILSAYFPLKSWVEGVIFFLLVITGLQYIFIKLSDQLPYTPIKHKTSPQEYLIRFLFCGSVIAGAMFMPKLIDSFWGVAIATSFPAAFSSTLMIFHYRYGSRQLSHIIRMLPIGVISILLYNIVITEILPFTNIWWATVIALGASLIASWFISFISNRFCD